MWADSSRGPPDALRLSNFAKRRCCSFEILFTQIFMFRYRSQFYELIKSKRRQKKFWGANRTMRALLSSAIKFLSMEFCISKVLSCTIAVEFETELRVGLMTISLIKLQSSITKISVQQSIHFSYCRSKKKYFSIAAREWLDIIFNLYLPERRANKYLKVN